MYKSIMLTISVLFISLLCTAQKVKSNTIIVKVKDEFRVHCTDNSINHDDLTSIFSDNKIDVVERMFANVSLIKNEKLKSDISLLYELTYSSNEDVFNVIKKLSSNHVFEYVEPYYIAEILYYPNDPKSDTLTGNQDFLTMHKVYEAWDITKGDSTILVGVSDTGINLNHEDLKGIIYKNKNDTIDGIDNDADGYTDNYVGWDFADNDNDVTEFGDHGSRAASCVSANTDNGIGIAGIGFNTKIVPLKAFSSGKFNGYASIIYSAEKNHDVINLSWGCFDCYANSLQDIINYAVLDNDLVVIASAGNTNADLDFYPASYDNVLSVTGLKGSFEKAGPITYSYKVDIAAKGEAVYTTVSNGGYGYSSGTSFSGPIVAGAAALVRDRFPNYTANQVIEQLRVTADSIYQIGVNFNYQDKLGKGSLNVFRAVSDTTTPAIRNIRKYEELESLLRVGDTIEIEGDFVNYLYATSNLKIELNSYSNSITMIDSVINIGVINMLDTFTNQSNKFSFVINSNALYNEEVWLRFSYVDGTYDDWQYLKIYLNKDYLTIDENNITVTVNSTGNIGYNIPNREQGVGFKYKGGRSVLYEAGLMIGSSDTNVSNNIRITGNTFSENFFLKNVVKEVDGTPFSDFKATCQFYDSSNTGGIVGVEVKQNIYAWNNAPNDNYIILEYEITNKNTDTIQELFSGIFADWDIGFSSIDNANWNHTRGFGYVNDPNNLNTYVGIKPLWPYYGTTYAIDNQDALAGNPLGIYSSFSVEKKYKTLSGEILKISAGELYPGGAGDVSHTVGGNMRSLAPNETKTIAFAIIAGDSLQDLIEAATNAQLKYGNPVSFYTPSPITKDTLICEGLSVNLPVIGQGNYKLYYSEHDFLVMKDTLPFTTPILYDTTTYYVAFGDSPFPSVKTPVTVYTYRPEIDFSVDPDTLYLQDRNYIYLTNKSPNYETWSWNFGNGISNSLFNPSITYDTSGVYEIILEILDSNNCSNELNYNLVAFDSAKFNSLNTGFDELIEIYPNPPQNTLFIQNSEGCQLNIFNSSGKLISEKMILNKYQQINTSALEKGIYFFELSRDEINVITKKIIID